MRLQSFATMGYDFRSNDQRWGRTAIRYKGSAVWNWQSQLRNKQNGIALRFQGANIVGGAGPLANTKCVRVEHADYSHQRCEGSLQGTVPMTERLLQPRSSDR